jgi:hypothetical protein
MEAAVYALAVVIVVQQIIHHYERKDLYDRIMSKTLTEYKGDSPGYHVSAHRRVLNRWRKHEEG